jgi:8-oxo-dGTP diphosphatase
MRDRPALAPPRSALRRATFSVDVVILTPRDQHLAVLFRRSRDAKVRDRLELPWENVRGGEILDEVARRLIRQVVHVDPAWMEQLGAFGDGKRGASDAELSICYVAVIAQGADSPMDDECTWIVAGESPTALSPRQRVMLERALAMLRARMDHAPIAFRLLPNVFTLSDLQQTYELLLGRRLHKASFRRALQAAFLVEPTDSWRSEGRGRPAQLFRYAPKRRRGGRRGVRFDLLA